MRLYTFGNYYLSSIQQGIQAAHVVSELFMEYPDEQNLYDWAKHHKTMICLSGGNSDDLHNLYARLAVIAAEFELPYTKFHEDEASLNGAITCCGIIVPMYFYEGAQEVRGMDFERRQYVLTQLSTVGWEFIDLLNSYGLAR